MIERAVATASPVGDSAAISPARRRQILQERATLLARPVLSAKPEEGLPVTCFTVAGVNYAVETSWVGEVFLLDEITPVPGTPSFLAGVVNHGGLILALLDTKVLLNLPAEGITDIHAVVVLRSDSVRIGLLADRLLGGARLSLEEMTAQPAAGGWRSEYLRGVTPDGTALLDAARILADDRLLIDGAVSKEALPS